MLINGKHIIPYWYSLLAIGIPHWYSLLAIGVPYWLLAIGIPYWLLEEAARKTKKQGWSPAKGCSRKVWEGSWPQRGLQRCHPARREGTSS